MDQCPKIFCSAHHRYSVWVILPFGWMTLGRCSFGVPGVLTSGVVFGEFREGDCNKKKKTINKVCAWPKVVSCEL